MEIYPYSLSIRQLRVGVHLGVGDSEQHKKQPVEFDITLYFPEKPVSCGNDNGDYLCYDDICVAVLERIDRQAFRLIEYLAQEVFSMLRDMLDHAGQDKARIRLELHKCVPPVPYMIGGASFTLTDLPAGLAGAH